MKYGAMCLIIFCAFVLLLVDEPAAHAAAFSWVSGLPTVFRSESTIVDDQPNCPTYVQKFHVEGVSGDRAMCVLSGSGIRLGNFEDDVGSSRLAISYPFDSDFHILSGVCEGLAGCLYSPDRDELVSRYGNGIHVYDGVRRRVRQTYDPGSLAVRYDFDTSKPLYSTPTTVPVGAIALSGNGKWLALEIKNLGTGLVDVDTGAARRIIAPGYQYGRGFDPREELAVSNDGTSVVVMGDNAGITFVSIDSDCGDNLEGSIEANFAYGIKLCKGVGIDPGAFIQSFVVGLSPKFDDSGGQLEFVAGSRGFGAKRVVLRAAGFDGRPELSYLALGDSFSSGEGETDNQNYVPGTDDEFERCHVSMRSYPFLLAAAMQLAPSSVKNVACSGAIMWDVNGPEDGYPGQEGRLGVLGLQLSSDDLLNAQANSLLAFLPGRIPQEVFVRHYQPDIVSVGIGGNDAGFMDKLKVCAMPGTCEWAATHEGEHSIGLEIQGLFHKLINLYRQLKLDAPFSHLYAVGYPEIMSSSGDCGPVISFLFDASERNLVTEGTHYLNQVIKAAAGTTGIPYLDIEQGLGGRELCDKSDLPVAVNGVRFGNDIAPSSLLPMLKIIGKESFHPNPIGHELIAQAILRQQTDLRSGSCDDCAATTDSPPLPDNWADSGGEDQRMSINAEIVSHTTITRQALGLAVSLPPGSLRPGSMAYLEVHSRSEKLGSFAVASDGSLVGESSLPSTTSEGFHTLHVYGESFSGQPVDLYQIISYDDQSVSASASGSGAPDGRTPFSRLGQSAVARASQSSAEVARTHPQKVLPSRRQALLIFAGTALVIVGSAVIILWRVRHNSTQDRGG